MNIIVCVKCVPSSCSGSQQRESGLEREKTMQILNPYDLYALEAALEIRDRLKDNVHITVLSMGPVSVREVLKPIFYLGVERMILLSDKAFAGSDTLATAYALQKAVEKSGEFDLIICGQQSADGDTGQVGPMLAGNLNIPFLTQVMKITDITPVSLTSTRNTDYETQVIKIPMPALLCIRNLANHPRSGNLKDYYKNKSREVELWDRETIGADGKKCGQTGSATKVLEIMKPPVKQNCEFIEGNTDAAADKLMDIFTQKGFVRNL